MKLKIADSLSSVFESGDDFHESSFLRLPSATKNFATIAQLVIVAVELVVVGRVVSAEACVARNANEAKQTSWPKECSRQ